MDKVYNPDLYELLEVSPAELALARTQVVPDVATANE